MWGQDSRSDAKGRAHGVGVELQASDPPVLHSWRLEGGGCSLQIRRSEGGGGAWRLEGGGGWRLLAGARMALEGSGGAGAWKVRALPGRGGGFC
ncbi:hypothetical protein ABZP36_030851 [Zizania latifolia]